MGTKRFNIRVWCMSASYNYIEYAQDKDAAIEIVKGKVMPDMKNWNFSASLADGNNCDDNCDDNCENNN
jgi:hypothetical protein